MLQIDAKKAMPPEQYKEMQMKNMKTCKIFCGGVPTDLEKEKIEEYFKAFGEVSVVYLVRLIVLFLSRYVRLQ